MSRTRRGRRAARAAVHRALLLLATALAVPDGAAGQEVAGRVIEGGGGGPVAGAMVLLVEGGLTLGRALTGPDGSFSLSVQPGRVQLRVDRIGYASTVTEPFEVAAGARVFRTVETPLRPVELAGIDVDGARRCEVRPAEGLATARVWEEARKALAAVTWTAERELYRIAWQLFERDIGEDGRRVLAERTAARRALTPQPFTSRDPALLAREGFVVPAGADLVYYAPDASVLLSDPFLDTHCLSIARATVDGERRIGIRFEPVAGRRLPDIEGVLWLAEGSARLRSIEYRYVNLGRRLDRASQEAAGELTFRGLPNGTWIVRDWRVRMPRIVEERDVRGQLMRYRVIGFQDEGGTVASVATAAGVVVADGGEPATIRGVVRDSLGAPAAGARVRIAGTDREAATDRDGRFAFDDLGPGSWTLSATHPALLPLGGRGAVADVAVERGGEASVALELPSIRGWALERCAEHAPGADGAVVLGRVLDEAGRPAAAAGVRAAWSDVRIAGAGRFRQTDEEIATESDEAGVFVLCGVPTEAALRVSAAADGRDAGPVELRIPEGDPVAALDLRLGGESGASVPRGPASALPDGTPASAWLEEVGVLLRRDAALLSLTAGDVAALRVDSLAQLLALAPAVEVRPRQDGFTDLLLHASAERAGAEPCTLDLYLNGSLVRQRIGLETSLELARFLEPRHLTALELFPAASAPVGRPDGCGAVLLWVERLREDDDPDFTGALHGRVVGATDGAPVPGVRVALDPGGLLAVTDGFGRFDFGWLPPARYRVGIEVPGGGSGSSEVHLRAGGTADVRLEIEPR